MMDDAEHNAILDAIQRIEYPNLDAALQALNDHAANCERGIDCDAWF